ncbi:MAG: glucosyltransferase domain-containing protein [Roseburia sp.]|nr:glucosyltransferase domain-containing protein [Roseburia sp.]
MGSIGRDLKDLWSKRCFAVCVPLITLLAYITQLFRPTVGIDDTSYKMYFVDGVAPAAGRWCLFLLRMLFPMDYNPYFIELLGILLFALSASLWCVVFYRLFGKELSPWVYSIAAGALVSSPILAEVVVWYLQNGIFIGYGVTALAVLYALEGLRAEGKSGSNPGRRVKILSLIGSMVLLTIALGFYESFVIVFMMAILLVFSLIRAFNKGGYSKRPLEWLWKTAVILGGALALRTLILAVLSAVYHLENQKLLKSRGLLEALGWFDGSKSVDDFVLMLKEFFVKYYLHGLVYLPVLILDLAFGVLVIWGIRYCIRKKDGWILMGVLGSILLPWLLAVLEGVATYYRSSQYVPLVTAVAVLLVGWELHTCKNGTVRMAAFFAAGILLYHQCYEMNKWLYVEAMKYEDVKRTLSEVAWVVTRSCDERKPVCMIGSYEIPESLLEDVYCPEWSKRYKLTEKLVKAVDSRIFEKYCTPRGYGAAETPQLNFMDWGMVAFHTYDRELIKFCRMHGLMLEEDLNTEHYREAQERMKDAPAWPAEGSVCEMSDYIIVNFGERASEEH